MVYPFIADNAELSANLGQAVGEANIQGDTAVYSTNEDGGICKMAIKFVKPRQIKVTQEQEDAGCGFGFNVSAQGTYKKISSANPKFETVE